METMTKERLEKYRSKKAEIPELKKKLADLGRGDSLIDNDVIMDYRKGYPRPQSVVGYDYEREAVLRERWSKRISKLEAECLAVELWIEEIPDSLTRRIFRMHYVDGMSQEKVARNLNVDRSNISKKISRFLKVSHNSHKSHL